jgi:hypothetical protein
MYILENLLGQIEMINKASSLGRHCKCCCFCFLSSCKLAGQWQNKMLPVYAVCKLAVYFNALRGWLELMEALTGGAGGQCVAFWA